MCVVGKQHKIKINKLTKKVVTVQKQPVEAGADTPVKHAVVVLHLSAVWLFTSVGVVSDRVQEH